MLLLYLALSNKSAVLVIEGNSIASFTRQRGTCEVFPRHLDSSLWDGSVHGPRSLLPSSFVAACRENQTMKHKSSTLSVKNLNLNLKIVYVYLMKLK